MRKYEIEHWLNMQHGRDYTLRRNDLLFPELSFQVNGILFEVYRQIGGDHPEKVYQKSVSIGLQISGIKFLEQHYVPVRFQSNLVGKYYLDFLIEDTIILELKRGRFVPMSVINQVKQYLSALNLKLALVACFTTHGVFIKRIINTQTVS